METSFFLEFVRIFSSNFIFHQTGMFQPKTNHCFFKDYFSKIDNWHLECWTSHIHVNQLSGQLDTIYGRNSLPPFLTQHTLFLAFLQTETLFEQILENNFTIFNRLPQNENFLCPVLGRHDTQHNDIQHTNTQHKWLYYNTKKLSMHDS